MADYIEREALKDRIMQEPTDGMFTHEILAVVDEFPAADVAPVRHGRWEPHPHLYGFVRCEICQDEESTHFESNKIWTYCNCCGAKMDLEGT